MQAPALIRQGEVSGKRSVAEMDVPVQRDGIFQGLTTSGPKHEGLM